MRTTWDKLLAPALPAALAILQACAGEAPSAPARGELVPASAERRMFLALLDQVVMDDPDAGGQPNVIGGFVQIKGLQEEFDVVEYSARGMIPNPGGILDVAGGLVLDPSGGVLFELENPCREDCPPVEHVVFLEGSATIGPDRAEQFIGNPDAFTAVVFFEDGRLIGQFKEIPIPEATR